MPGLNQKKSKNNKYYEILNISKNAGQDEVKKAYKAAALKNHPDKGGDPEKFKELSEAYEVLNGPKKREIYDQNGEDQGMGGADDEDDSFDIFGGGNYYDCRVHKQGKDIVHILKVSLEDLYNGPSKKLSISRNVLCSKCKGKGSKSGKSSTCHVCEGSGVKVEITQLYPGIFRPIQSVCPSCTGAGEIIKKKDRCVQCKGGNVTQRKKVLEVHVEKGLQDGEEIVLKGEADEAPDTVTRGHHLSFATQ